MAAESNKTSIDRTINRYIEVLRNSGLNIWRIYLYGSHAKGSYGRESDIDLAVFLDTDEIDGFEEDALLMKLRRRVDLAIEPHAFARKDFDEADPFVKEIITTGRRIA